MTRCRLHVFPPGDDDVDGESDEVQELRAEMETVFEDLFTRTDAAPIQDTSREWVSEVFEEEDGMDRVDEFEERCLDIYPDADVLRTRQDREIIDGRAEEQGYDEAIIFQVTYAIST